MTRLSQTGVWAGMLLLALLASLIVIQVVARNFFDKGLPWADELARFSCFSLVFLSVPLLALKRAMVSVTLFQELVGDAVRRWLQLLSEMSLLAFAGFMLWGFAAYLPRAGKFLTPAMGMPNWWFYSLALIGTIVLAIVALLLIAETLTNASPSKPRESEQ
ncbi:TRAP-type C4-dicarboxylate transport system, small permease component [Cohaesibacter sp. ES.047]|uniref:TRAP transporter small permease n=1 Tax=Cohaesibacter sp. ES.047 TaxID=1798205 RepID=UPI000BBF5278|nr:TRAP transporter small permease [Cohaesibacter sp. ES.047]SNY93467.1 TRAP-type C4-dicarboxylate transport system, small permease component [Cohaesibacter sp. ES.047]